MKPVAIYYSTFGLIFAGAAVLALRTPDHKLTPPRVRRIPWALGPIAGWIVVYRFLAMEASDICARRLSPVRRGDAGAFLNCTPELLAGGAADIVLFLWVWAPPLLVAAMSAAYLLRSAQHFVRRSRSAGQ